MPNKKSRRWAVAAKIRRRVNIPKTTFYRLIKEGFILSRSGISTRKTTICVGYADGETDVSCLEKNIINCKNCEADED